MTRLSCDEIADRLVDYADGELAEAESAEIAAHLARCDICRGQLAALHKSLELAQTIWDDNETDLAAAGSQPAAQFTRPRVAWRLLRPAAAIAAAVALLVTVGLYQRSAREHVPASVQQSPSPTVRELELRIARAGIAMQLLTAADILAEQPGGEEFACERYRYVVGSYPDTEAALQSKSRLASLCEERNGS